MHAKECSSCSAASQIDWVLYLSMYLKLEEMLTSIDSDLFRVRVVAHFLGTCTFSGHFIVCPDERPVPRPAFFWHPAYCSNLKMRCA